MEDLLFGTIDIDDLIKLNVDNSMDFALNVEFDEETDDLLFKGLEGDPFLGKSFHSISNEIDVNDRSVTLDLRPNDIKLEEILETPAWKDIFMKSEPELILKDCKIELSDNSNGNSDQEMVYIPTSDGEIEVVSIETPPTSPVETVYSSSPQQIYLINPPPGYSSSNVIPVDAAINICDENVSDGKVTPSQHGNMIPSLKKSFRNAPLISYTNLPVDTNSIKTETNIVSKISKVLPNETSTPPPIASNWTRQQWQAYKRQQRMIKNREAANISRKKKKEYVSSLEDKIKQLECENMALKEENEFLKGTVKLFSQLTDDKSGGFVKRSKKFSAILSIVLLVSLNIASFSGSLYSDVELSKDNGINVQPISTHRGRSLLWINDSESLNLENNLNLNSNTTNWRSMKSLEMKCPLYINQTESIRLDNELRRWIGKESHSAADNITSNFVKTKLHREGDDVNKISFSSPLLLSSFNNYEKNLLLKNLNEGTKPRLSEKTKREQMDFFHLNNGNQLNDNLPFYQAMDRRQDTYYFVSFSEDHLLLPALDQNITFSPKMSLLLPTAPIKRSVQSSDIITMMKIDCAVTDTRILHVKEKDIPIHLRSHSLKLHSKGNSSSSYIKRDRTQYAVNCDWAQLHADCIWNMSRL